MTSPNDLYAALVARYGKHEVKLALVRYECEWCDDADDAGGLLAFGSVYQFSKDEGHGDHRFLILTAPVALAVLCEVGEAMLMGDGCVGATRVERNYWGPGWKWSVVSSTGGDKTANICYPTKSAAIIAALGGKQ